MRCWNKGGSKTKRQKTYCKSSRAKESLTKLVEVLYKNFEMKLYAATAASRYLGSLVTDVEPRAEVHEQSGSDRVDIVVRLSGRPENSTSRGLSRACIGPGEGLDATPGAADLVSRDVRPRGFRPRERVEVVVGIERVQG